MTSPGRPLYFAYVRTHANKRVPQPTREGRRKAARDLDGILESKVFRALCEPARIEILKLLTVEGRLDGGAVAARVPQDRSVVSRHLAQLHAAGCVRREKLGRNVFFEVDGPAIVAQLDAIVARFRALVSLCCPD